MSNTYRADIDGLRAIAVLSVVVFHAFPNTFPGGLIGVDIFFVISGFLITNLINSDLQKNIFSFFNFYSRRIKRIVPILLTVLVCTYAFGWFVLYFEDYELLGKHLAAAASFTSNFIYLGEAGYFDADSDAKPLLHLWSLAIEEQFYLVWPILLFLCSKKIKLTDIKFIAALFFTSVLSFGYCIYLTGSSPDAAYYLPTARFWELSFGGFIALISKKYKVHNSLNQYSTLIGLFLLTSSYVLINGKSEFPGYIALLPCVGVAAILISNENSKGNELLLRNKVLIFFGLTSYSFYLWHWPVLFFARNLIPNPNALILSLALMLSLIISVVGYYVIESPLRRINSKGVSVILIFGLLAIGFIGWDAFRRNGLDFREINGRVVIANFIQHKSIVDSGLNSKVVSVSFSQGDSDKTQLDNLVFKLRHDPESYKKIKLDSETANNKDLFCSSSRDLEGICQGSGQISGLKFGLSVMIVGDSHGANFLQAMKIAYPEINFISFVEGGCVPISKRYPQKDTLCRRTILGAMNYVEKNPVDLVLLSARWPGSIEEIQSDLDHYKKFTSKVILVGPSLVFAKDVSKIIADYTSATSFNDYVQDNFEASCITRNNFMQRFAIDNGVSFINKISLFCPDNLCPLFEGERLFIFDKGHLTTSGAFHLAKHLQMEDPIGRILGSNGPIAIQSPASRQKQ
jgi:peptidoglycan/LPS O-acetylase OafA/YrhL